MSLSVIRPKYCVPATQGASVRFEGQAGRITGSGHSGGEYVCRVKLDGEKKSRLLHPTLLVYFDEQGNQLWPEPVDNRARLGHLILNRVNCGDARALLGDLPDNSIHCVVTSVAYYGLRRYMLEEQEDGTLVPLPGAGDEMGNEETVQEFVAELVEVSREIWRVLHPSGGYFINIGDAYAGTGSGQKSTGKLCYQAHTYPQTRPTPSKSGVKRKSLWLSQIRLLIALIDDGWIFRNDIIWEKPDAAPGPGQRWSRNPRNHEYIYHLAKSPKHFWDAIPTMIPNGKEASLEEYAAAMGTNSRADAFRETQGYQKHSTPITHPAGAYLRSVWKMAKRRKLNDKHWAVFPPELPRRCILQSTSEVGCCPTCLAPWRRVTADGKPDREWQKACGGDAQGLYHGQAQAKVPEGIQDASKVKSRILASQKDKITLGWIATCDCGPHEPIPCRVLDPFAGSGTTIGVAMELGRDAVGIDLHPGYVETANEVLADVERGLPLAEAGKFRKEREEKAQLSLFGGDA